MTWKGESQRHAMASRGIRTRGPRRGEPTGATRCGRCGKVFNQNPMLSPQQFCVDCAEASHMADQGFYMHSRGFRNHDFVLENILPDLHEKYNIHPDDVEIKSATFNYFDWAFDFEKRELEHPHDDIQKEGTVILRVWRISDNEVPTGVLELDWKHDKGITNIKHSGNLNHYFEGRGFKEDWKGANKNLEKLGKETAKEINEVYDKAEARIGKTAKNINTAAKKIDNNIEKAGKSIARHLNKLAGKED